MSATDVETIRRGVAALNRGDVDGMAATLDPDVELVPLRAVLDGTSYRGHEGLRRWMDDMVEDWTRFEIALDEVRELRPGRVLVRATMRMRGRSSGVALDSPRRLAVRHARRRRWPGSSSSPTPTAAARG